MPFYAGKKAGPWEYRWALWAVTVLFSVIIAVCATAGQAFETPCRVLNTACTGCCAKQAGSDCAGSWKLELSFRTPKFGRQNGTLTVDCVGGTIEGSGEPCSKLDLVKGQEFTCYVRDRQPQLYQSLSVPAVLLIVLLAMAIIGCGAYNIHMARRLGVNLCFCGEDDEEKAKHYASDRKAAIWKDAADRLSKLEAEQREAAKKKQEMPEQEQQPASASSKAGLSSV
eukprot:PLAT15502.1.p2 GENE.PLAT15502.1~~PLAT15502.1.p2  ORF type:complete len:226 (-),score=37.75 PLAT15502.1:119-796(-)